MKWSPTALRGSQSPTVSCFSKKVRLPTSSWTRSQVWCVHHASDTLGSSGWTRPSLRIGLKCFAQEIVLALGCFREGCFRWQSVCKESIQLDVTKLPSRKWIHPYFSAILSCKNKRACTETKWVSRSRFSRLPGSHNRTAARSRVFISLAAIVSAHGSWVFMPSQHISTGPSMPQAQRALRQSHPAPALRSRCQWRHHPGIASLIPVAMCHNPYASLVFSVNWPPPLTSPKLAVQRMRRWPCPNTFGLYVLCWFIFVCICVYMYVCVVWA